MSNLKRHCCLRREQHDGKRGHSCDNKSIQYPLIFEFLPILIQFKSALPKRPSKMLRATLQRLYHEMNEINLDASTPESDDENDGGAHVRPYIFVPRRGE